MDDLEEILAGALGQLLHAHVVNDEQVRLEILAHQPVVLRERLVLQEVADDIEDRAGEYDEAQSDELLSYCLAEMTFPNTWRAREQIVHGLAHELAGRHFIKVRTLE